jgi:hypothetical protein
MAHNRYEYPSITLIAFDCQPVERMGFQGVRSMAGVLGSLLVVGRLPNPAELDTAGPSFHSGSICTDSDGWSLGKIPVKVCAQVFDVVEQMQALLIATKKPEVDLRFIILWQYLEQHF